MAYLLSLYRFRTVATKAMARLLIVAIVAANGVAMLPSADGYFAEEVVYAGDDDDDDDDGKHVAAAVVPANGNGQWVAGWNDSCNDICGRAGMAPSVSPSGAQCTSGEVTIRDAAEALGYGIYRAGCWSNDCPWNLRQTPFTTVAVGRECYHPGQKQDHDSTDKIAACYCAPLAPACSDGKDNDGDGLVDFPQDPGCTSATDTDESPKNAPKLDVTKNGPSKINAGENIVYTFTTENKGNAVATDVTLHDFYISGGSFQYVSSNANCSFVNNQVLCRLGNIAPGATVNTTITFTSTENTQCGHNVMNQVDVHLNGQNIDGVSDWDKHQVKVECQQPKLNISKDGPNDITAGQNVTYTITVENNGDGIARHVTVHDTFISGGEFTFISDSRNACSPEGKFMVCTIGDIPADGETTIQLTYSTQANQYCGQTVMNQADAHINRQVINGISDWDKHQVDVDCAPLPECSDGVDNDGDGFIDFPNDPACDNAQDDNEGDNPECSDGVDNDNDGTVDALITTADLQNTTTGDTKVFALPHEVQQAAVNAGAPQFGNGQNPRNDAKTREKICAAAGYDRVASYNGQAWHSPGDNGTWGWSGTTWYFTNGNHYNNWLASLTCADPIAPSAACSDGIDNDNDGLVDFPQDPGCASANDIDERQHDLACSDPRDDDESDPAQCEDGFDNDGDGFTDFPADGGCDSPDDNDETGEPDCQDGIDNDNDGFTDFPEDPACTGPQDDDESPKNAPDLDVEKQGPNDVDAGGNITYEFTVENDGNAVANDVAVFDFFIDGNTGHRIAPPFTYVSATQNCSYDTGNNWVVCQLGDIAAQSQVHFSITFSTPANQFCGTTVMNQVDAHLNGQAVTTTASDWDKHEVDVDCPVLPECSDGIDNDNDGRIDAQDPACHSDNDPNDDDNSYNPNDDDEGDDTECSDVADNDNDGRSDAQDPGCHTDFDPNDGDNSYDPSDDNEDDEPACSDGIDNDNDNFVDLNDPGCSDPTDDDESDDPACSDGMDNDNDGFTDFPEDPACTGPQDDDESPKNAPQLDINKEGPRTITAGNTITYEFTVENDGSATANNVIIVDYFMNDNNQLIDAPFTFISSSNGSCTYQSTNKWVYCSIGNLAPNEEKVVTLTFSSPALQFCGESIDNQVDAHINGQPVTTNASDWDSHEVDITCVAGSEADLDIEKTGPANLMKTFNGDYEITVENNGPDDASNVMVTDTIPYGFTFDGANSDNRCNLINTDTVTCSLGTLDDGDEESLVIRLNLTPLPVCNSIATNRVEVTSSTYDPNTSNNEATANTRVLCPTGGFDIVKSGGAATANPGDTLTYTVTVTNESGIDAYARIIDPVPQNLTFVSGTAGCYYETFTDEVICPEEFLAAGDSRTVTLTFRVDNNITSCTIIENQADVWNRDANIIPPQWSNVVRTEVLCDAPDLSATKTVDETSINLGDRLEYTITVENDSDTDAENVVIRDTIPNGLTFNDNQSSNECNQQGGTIVCNVGTVRDGDTESVSLVFTATHQNLCSAQVSNTARVSADNHTDVTTNQVTTNVQCPNATLDVTKSTNVSVVERDDIVTYDITVENDSNVDAENVMLFDVIPDHLMYLDGSSTGICSENDQSVACGPFDLDAGDARDFEITFKVLDTAPCNSTITNRAHTDADNAAEAWSNQVDLTVDCDTGLEPTKTVNKTEVTLGDSLEYDIVLENTGQTTLTDIWVIDTIPNGLTFDSSNSDNRCFKQGNAIKCGNDDIFAGNNDVYTIAFTVNNDNSLCGTTIENVADGLAQGVPPISTNRVYTDVECDDPEIEVTKTADRSTATEGDIVIYTITVENNSNIEAENITITDSLIPELMYLPGQSSGNCTVQHNAVVCGPVDIDPFDDVEFQIGFKILADACGETVVNQVEARGDNVEPTLSNTETVQVDCDDSADVRIQKSGATQILRGTTLVYTLVAQNDGPDRAEDVVVYDTIPEVLVQDTTTYTDLVFNPGQSDNRCDKVGNQIICDGFDLDNNETRSLSVAFDVPANAFCAKPIVNNVTIDSATADPSLSNNDDTHVSTVNCATTTLDISKHGPATVLRGDEITYTINVENNLGYDTIDNRVIDPVPEYLEFVSSSSNLCYYESFTNEVICGDFDLDDGDDLSFTLTFRVASNATCDDDIMNIADVWSGNSDPQWSNAVRTEVLCPQPTFNISKTDGRATVNPGEQLTYTISVTNTSQYDADDTLVVDELPNGVTFVSASDNGQLMNGDEVQWTLDLDAGDTEQLTVTVRVDDNAINNQSLVNEVCVDTTVCDDDTTVVEIDNPSFAISKTDNRATVNPGEQLTYFITITNTSSVNATDVEIIDTLPSDVTFVSASDNAVHSNGEVTWEIDLDAGDTEQLTVIVTVDNNAQSNDVLYNTVEVTGGPNDDDTTVVVVNQPTLTISKTDNRATANPGEQLTYTITVVNTSSTDATNVEVIDTLPSYVSYLSASDNGSFSNGQVTWNIDVDANSTEQLTVIVEVDNNAPNNQVLFNLVEITGGPDDNDTTTVEVNQQLFGCIDVIKETFDTQGNPLTPVTQFTFTLDNGTTTVVNDSTGHARFNNVPVGSHRVTETVPTGWTQQLVTPSNGEVTVQEGTNCATVTFKNRQNQLGTPQFTITKTDNRVNARRGDTLSYQMTITNTSSVDATNVEVYDFVPGNTQFISASNNGSYNGNQVTWFFNLTAGQSLTFSLQARVNNSVSDGETVFNTVTVQNGPSATDTTLIEVDDDGDDDDGDDNFGGDVNISIDDNPDPVDVCYDDDIEYEIRLTNDDNSSRNVDVIALLDSRTDYLDASNDGDEISGNRVEWEDISIGSNSSRTLRVRVRIDDNVHDGDTVRLSASVSAGDSDTEVTRVQSNCGDNDDGYDGPPNVSIDKTADRSEALAGSIVSYTITLRNTSNQDVINATLEDAYPENMIAIEDSGGASDDGSTLRWNLGTLRANSTTVVRYRARVRTSVPQGASIRNTATVRSGTLTRTDDHVIIVPQPPQTGETSFLRGQADANEQLTAVSPQPRSTSADAGLPFTIWLTTILTGLGLGGAVGRRFLF